jgi:transposase
VDFLLTGGEVSDYTPAVTLLGQRQVQAVIADKGYDSDAIVEHIEAKMGSEPVIPPRSNRKKERGYDKTLYQRRSRIEGCFSKLKHLRRFATRYEKSKCSFKAIVQIACAWIRMKLYVDTA